jgi:hypothetical protein
LRRGLDHSLDTVIAEDEHWVDGVHGAAAGDAPDGR